MQLKRITLNTKTLLKQCKRSSFLFLESFTGSLTLTSCLYAEVDLALGWVCDAVATELNIRTVETKRSLASHDNPERSLHEND